MTSVIPAAWENIGGVSPTVPISTLPAFMASINCGPAGNGPTQFTVTPNALKRGSTTFLTLTISPEV